MANNLVNFYKTGISQPQLNEGEYKNCTLIKHELNETKPENPYIVLQFKTENGRILKENRFNQGFQIFVTHLKKQLDRGNEEIGVQEFLDGLIEKKTQFTIWITKHTPASGGQTRSNFNFLEPRKATNTESDTGVSVDAPASDEHDDEVEDPI